LNINISQGSVATYLRCGGITEQEFVANLPLSLPAKNFENWLTFGEVMGKSLVSCFLTHGVHMTALKMPTILHVQNII